MCKHLILALPLTCLVVLVVASTSPVLLVVCAPGFPGTTEEAQTFMDGFAAAAADGAGWGEGVLSATYFESEEAGLSRLAAADAGVALVPLPFLLQHATTFDLVPLLRAVQDHKKEQQWALVAKKGAIAKPEQLAGWKITGRPGYSPGFVRGPILGSWGDLPDDVSISFTKRPLSALRRAARGENVAVILDREQTESLSSLPFGKDLEIVTRSEPMPGMLLCSVGDRLDGARKDELVRGLLKLHKSSEGSEILRSIWMSHFEKVDGKSLDKARQAYTGL